MPNVLFPHSVEVVYYEKAGRWASCKFSLNVDGYTAQMNVKEAVVKLIPEVKLSQAQEETRLQWNAQVEETVL